MGGGGGAGAESPVERAPLLPEALRELDGDFVVAQTMARPVQRFQLWSPLGFLLQLVTLLGKLGPQVSAGPGGAGGVAGLSLGLSSPKRTPSE